MKKPKFLNLNKFTEDPMECDKSILIEWIKKTYKITIIKEIYIQVS